jgi:putative SOS response-associated peptidase YedK
MCGRFSFKASPDDIRKVFAVEPPAGYRPRYNIAPSQDVLALVLEEGGSPPEEPAGGGKQARMLRWGLVPFWADDPRIGNRMINARAETVAEKPAYRAAFRKQRCLVLADGFYEWRSRPEGKQPMRIRRPGELPFFFAALWDRWDRGTRPSRAAPS